MALWRAGADIDSFCGHCKLDLAHVIIAMDGAKPARVQCKTCGSIHGYRRTDAHAGVARAPARPKGGPPKHAGPSPDLTYAELIRGRDVATAKPYSLAGHFLPKDLLRHRVFGLGVVVGTPAGDKIAVVFACGLKILAHGRTNTP